MKKRLENNIFHLGLIIISLILIFYTSSSLTGFSVFSTDSETNFDEGFYNQTFYNPSKQGIQLNKSQGFYEGTYISKIFNANSEVLWNEISWEGNSPNIYINLELDNHPVENKEFNKTKTKINKKDIDNVIKRTYLNFQIKNCSSNDCSDSEFSENYSNNSLSLNLTGKYFQYKFNFLTEDLSETPILYKVTINYTILNQAPIVDLDSPENNSQINTSSILLEATFYDIDTDNLNIYFIGDEELININNNLNNITTTTYNWTNLSEGNHNWTVIANDGNSNSTNEFYYFNVNIPNETTEESLDTEETPSSNVGSGSSGSRSSSQKEPKEDSTEEEIQEEASKNLIQESPTEKTNENQQQDFITGFITFTLDNWTRLNGALALFMLLVLVYIFVIRPKYRQEKQPKKRKKSP